MFSDKKKPLLFLLFSLLAILSHKSSVVLLPFYFIANDSEIKNLKVFYAVFVPLLLVIILLPKTFFRSVIEWFLKLFNDPNYKHYFENDGGNTAGTLLNYGTSILYILCCLPKLKGKTLMFSKLYLVNLVLGLLCYHVSMLVRFQMFFEPFAFLALPLIIKDRYCEFFKKEEKTTEDVFVFLLVDILLPLLVFKMYFIQYRWFFTDTMYYSKFHKYGTIFGLLKG
jgi:hypothetical protein